MSRQWARWGAVPVVGLVAALAIGGCGDDSATGGGGGGSPDTGALDVGAGSLDSTGPGGGPDAAVDASNPDAASGPDATSGEDGGPTGADAGDSAEGDTASPCPPAPVAPEAGVVSTDAGAVRGAKKTGVLAWKGVPFARPPVGELRWRMPEPPLCWEGVREASSFPPPCLQRDFQVGQPTADAPVIGDEDCLYLNVWAPDAPDAPRPVMVFIHGGGNVGGASSNQAFGVPIFDGQGLVARTGAVLVTIQYRLGPLGFLSLPELPVGPEGGAGNLGILDQVEALRWVQRNIALFGGDPDDVMIFGESAGSVDTCALLASPLAAGLFHRALMQSGGCVAAPLAKSRASGEEYAAAVGCADPADRLACLAGLSPDALLGAVEHPFTGGIAGGSGFGPTIDGWVLLDDPQAVIEAGDHNHVPVVVGANADETQITIPVGTVTPAMVKAALNVFPEPFATQLAALYPPGATPAQAREAWIRATTDAQFLCPARRAARALRQTQTEPVWRYHFTHTAPPKFGAENGAFHGLELMYLFGSVQQLFGGIVATPADDGVVALMQGAWARFAETGDPNGEDLPAWPPYEVAADPYLEIAAPPSAGAGVRSAECDVWDAIVALL